MLAGGAPRPGQLRPEMGGVAMYTYLLGDALLTARFYNTQTKQAQVFHAACNWFMTLTHPTTKYYDQTWTDWQLEVLTKGLEDQSQAEYELDKKDRLREIAHALELLQEKGIFWFKKGQYAGDAEGLGRYFDGDEGRNGEGDEAERESTEESGPPSA